jgi:hypothetical protein
MKVSYGDVIDPRRKSIGMLQFGFQTLIPEVYFEQIGSESGLKNVRKGKKLSKTNLIVLKRKARVTF